MTGDSATLWGPCVDLDRDAAQVVHLRHLPVHLTPEEAAAQLLELDLVLAADECASEDEDVVQVLVRVGEGEVGRAGTSQSRTRQPRARSVSRTAPDRDTGRLEEGD